MATERDDGIYFFEEEPETVYAVAQLPKAYIRGSVVFDKIFGTDTARDVDVVFPMPDDIHWMEPSEYKDMPDFSEIARGRRVDSTGANESKYFPVQFSPYNIDRYFMFPDGKIIKPEGYPDKPAELYVVSDLYGMTAATVIRGIKAVRRYGLKPTDELIEEWRNEMKEVYSQEQIEIHRIPGEGDDVALKGIKEMLEHTLALDLGDDEREPVYTQLCEYAGFDLGLTLKSEKDLLEENL